MKRKLKHLVIFMVIVLLSHPVLHAEQKKCYVTVEKAGNFDANIILSSTISIISRYIKKVEAPPPGGLKFDACTYTVNLTESLDGFYISLAGEGLNAYANSKLHGMDGFTQALLRSIYSTLEDDSLKSKICRNHNQLLASDCKSVEAVIYLYNDRDEMIPSGSIVRKNDRFNIMIQPVSFLYAYIISLDSSGNFIKVFPNSDISDINNPLRRDVQYYFPPQDSDMIFAFDDNPGTEKIYFFLSSSPVSDIDRFFDKIKNNETKVERQKAISVFENELVSRGFKMKKKKIQVPLNDPSKKDGYQTSKVMAEVLKGTGMLVRTITLKHVR